MGWNHRGGSGPSWGGPKRKTKGPGFYDAGGMVVAEGWEQGRF